MTVAKESTREEAHFGLMRLYALSGRESEALLQYERLREALSGHLGMEPGTRTRTLHEDIAAGRFPRNPASTLVPREWKHRTLTSTTCQPLGPASSDESVRSSR